MKKPKMLCFYHKNDLDGHCSGAIIKYRYPECELIGIDYDDQFPWDKITSDLEVFMVDFHLQPFEDMIKLAKNCKLTWIDHHKSAEEDFEKYADARHLFRLVYIDLGYAACELLWKELYHHEPIPHAVHLLGRYDIWDHSDKNTLPFQYGMRLHDTDPNNQGFWRRIFEEQSSWIPTSGHDYLMSILYEGQTVLKYVKSYHAKYAQSAFEVEFDGLKCIAINKLMAGSQLFDSVWDKKKYHAMVAFGFKGNKWLVSLYSDRDDVDLSKVAKKRGGGGHRLASGFYTETLPWEKK